MEIIADSTFNVDRVSTLRLQTDWDTFERSLSKQPCVAMDYKMHTTGGAIGVNCVITTRNPSFLPPEWYLEWLRHPAVETRCHLPFTSEEDIAAFYAVYPDALDSECFQHFAETNHDVFLGETT